MRYLADTHAFLWLLFDDARLSADAERLMLQQSNVVLSVVSLWEIAVKVTIGKLRLGMPYDEFIERHVTGVDIDLLQIELAHLKEYVSLPMHHRDPFDRLLIAQARASGCAVLTSDPRFAAYDVQVVW
jgi:PIN domain nuclease of toxin-antitoxin system